MGSIKDLLTANEKVLWEKIVAKDKPKERIFVVTNMRVYKKSQDIPTKQFPGAPKDFLKVKDDILIIERTGIRQIRIRERKSLTEKILKKIIESKDKSGAVKENIDKAKASLEKGEVPDFKFDDDTPKETQDKVLKYAKKIVKFLSRNKINIYLHNAASNRAFMVIDRLSKEESDEVTKILEYFEGIAGESFLPDSLQQPYSEPNWPTGEPIREVITRRPGQVEYTPSPEQQEQFLTPSTFKEVETTCQITEITNPSQYEGKNCIYCGNDLAMYAEKIYTCQGCGVFYHHSCLHIQVGEGFCLGCNKILLW
jgi:hypothetical protein